MVSSAVTVFLLLSVCCADVPDDACSLDFGSKACPQRGESMLQVASRFALPDPKNDLNGPPSTDTAPTRASAQMTLSGNRHADNEECGYNWTMPMSDISVRSNLVAGATVIFAIEYNKSKDCGQYISNFPEAKVILHEPVPASLQDLQQQFGKNPNVKINPVGVANSNRRASFLVASAPLAGLHSFDRNSSQYQNIDVELRDVDALLDDARASTGQTPDVVSINCEGCEYEVLTRMAQTGWLGAVPFLQVSWHAPSWMPDRVRQRCAIENVLLEKYVPTYYAVYGWQGWTSKKARKSGFW